MSFASPGWLSARPGVRAASQFFLATLRHSARHRFVLAAALGLSAPWGLANWSTSITVPRADLLALPLALMLFGLAGLRLAAALPSSLEPAWLFDLLPVSRRDRRLAVERVMFGVGVLPVVLAFTILFWSLWGGPFAILHALLSLALGTLAIQILLWRFGAMPCAVPWNWRSAVRWTPGYLAGLLIVIRGLPALEVLLAGQPAMGALFGAYLLTVAWGIRSRAARVPPEDATDAVEILTAALRAGQPARAAARPSPSPRRPVATACPLSPPSRSRSLAAVFQGLPDELTTSVMLASRRLVAAPAFSVFSILTLACGIGLTTAAYSVLRSLLWTPPPVRDIARLVDLSGLSGRGRAVSHAFSLPDLEDLDARQTSLEGLAAATVMTSAFVSAGVAEFVTGEAVNGRYFSTFGVTARVGRLIEPADDQPGATPVVVLSDTLWRLRFGGDPSVVGRTVKIDRQVHEVVGVAAEHFSGWELGFRSRPPAVWVPLRSAAGDVRERRESGRRDFRWLAVKARLAPGRSIAQASADVAAIGRGLDAEIPSASTSGPGSGRRWSARPIAVRDAKGGSAAGAAALAAVGLVLLIGCTTLANLALARGAAREHERGVQRALGASRGRLVREQIVESLVVTLAGGLMAVPIVLGLITMLTRELPFGPGQYVLIEPHLDLAVLGFGCAAALVAFAISGVWPALQLTRSSLWSSIASEGPATPARARLHRRLIAGQVAGSMGLFLVAAACIQAIVANARHDSGVDVDRIAMVGVSFSSNHRDEGNARRTVQEVLRQARRQPGIDAAAASRGLPFGAGWSGTWSLSRLDQLATPAELEEAQLVAGTPEIFATLGVPIVAGRRFDDRDRSGGQLVVVVSAGLARRLFGAGDAVGRVVRLSHQAARGGPATSESLTIVGIARDTDARQAGARDLGVVYVPLDQHYDESVLFSIRTSGDPAAALATMKSVLQQTDPDLAIDLAQTGSQMLGPYGVLAVVAAVVTTFGSIALVLTMVGLSGVVSLVVSRRMRELGVRMALGAGRGRIVGLVLVDGLHPVVQGVGLGLVLGAVGRMAVGVAVGRPVSAVDPIAFIAVPVLLVAAAVAACYLPARRAADADPSVVLRRS